MASGNFDSNIPGVPAVNARATAPGPGSNGVHGITSSNADSAGYFEHTDGGIGVFSRGGPNGGSGVHGASTGPDFPGVFGESAAGNGVEGFTASGASGVKGRNTNTLNDIRNYIPASTNPGVFGDSASGTGVVGISSLDLSSPAGVSLGQSGVGVVGINAVQGGRGVLGQANGFAGVGVSGVNSDADGYGAGVWGVSGVDDILPQFDDFVGMGVRGFSNSGYGVIGISDGGTGVAGSSGNGAALAGRSENVAVYAQNGIPRQDSPPGESLYNVAYLGTRINSGDFYGEVSVHGRLNKFGGGFRIDHPLDPAAKYFSHSFVESADMKNIYDGIAVLDAGGEAEIELPSWFGTINTDCRYQLTCMGGYAPIFIAQEVQSNRFKIGGGAPGMKVSWQITGSRQDAWAKAHPLPVEEDKPAGEQGYYLDPELYGVSGEQHIRNARYPELTRLASRPPQRGRR